jgi:peptidyl-prolyl cis-trans isomerase B (cyclophilin B)
MKRILLFILVLFGIGCAPKASFHFSEGPLQAPAAVQFKNMSSKAETYQWDFGDGTTSTETSPAHRYLRSGEFEVTLSATKGNKTKEHSKSLTVNAPETCLIEIQTSHGNMTVKLSDETPLHRDNFIKLAEEGFFDGLLFHRVINGFMIQGGDPQSRNAPASQQLGSGGPGYQVAGEFVDDLVHVKGAIAAARTGDAVNPEKKSSGSQFYVVHGRPITEQELSTMEQRNDMHYSPEQRAAYLKNGGAPFLDGEYTVFGQVISGLEVIDAIASSQTDRNDRPREDVAMKVVVIK